MMKLVGKRWSFVCLVVLALAAPVATAENAIKRLVIFGDSLSDSGNAFALVGEASTPPSYSFSDPAALLVPDKAYARGGHHFTNGATWIEQLARPMGLAGSARPVLLSSGGGTNFAVGGARSAPDSSGVDLSSQVQAFLAAASGHQAPADALYVVEIGGNDVRDALIVASSGGDPTSILNAAAQSIVGNIASLYGAGARKFLVWNVPNVGRTPAAQAFGPGAVAGGAQLASFFNAGLANAFYSNDPAHPGLTALLPGINIVTFDAYTLLDTIHDTPAAFGLSNVQSPCVQPNVAPYFCQNADEYLFWDGIHPTAAAHAIIAQRAAAAIAH